MKKKTNIKKLSLYSLIGILAITGSIVTLNRETPTRKTIFIIVDGVPADVMERVHPPSIFAIGQEGGYTQGETGGLINGFSQTPTISAVGYNNLLTSTWVNKHNVWGNDISAPNYHYKNIFRIAKEQTKPATTAVFSGWEENRTKLIGDRLAEAGNVTVDFHLDGLDKNKTLFPDEDNHLQIFKIDEKVTDAAAQCILESGPDLTWLYLWYMDDAGHLTGTGDYFDEYLIKADQQVERIRKAVAERMKTHNEDWLIIVTSDHGRKHPDGHGHGGQTERERSIWISMNKQPNSYFQQDPLNDITDITPTIARFMQWEIPDPVRYEWDGAPLIGEVDTVNPIATKKDNAITLTWEAYSSEPIEIFMTTSNNAAKGEDDSWTHLGSVSAAQKEFTFTPTEPNLPFYKFSLRGKNNASTTWLKETTQK